MPPRSVPVAFLVGLAMSCAASVRGAEPAADNRQIDRLVRQLGSDSFEEREAATAALARIGGPALPALRKAASENPDAEARRRAAELISGIENSLDQLLADYRAYGLPLPPDGAPLVRFEERSSGILESSDGKGHTIHETTAPEYALGFIVTPTTKDREAKLLHGSETRYRNAEKIDCAPAPQRLSRDYMKDYLPDPPNALALALQMHARGWDAARFVFEKGFREKSRDTARTALRLLAWDYWDKRLVGATDDCWPAAARQMRALLADEPELDTPENRGLLKSLEAALVPSKAKPGSVESLMDGLMLARRPYLEMDPYTGDPPDGRFIRVFELGFDAVPALIEHLDDDRLTHYVDVTGFFCGVGGPPPPSHWGVADMAGELLQSIAGKDSELDLHRDRENPERAKRRAQDWWDHARRDGEEAYLVAHVLLKPGRRSDEQWDAALIRLLAIKYPHSLLRLYRETLKDDAGPSAWRLAQSVATSSLCHDEKVQVLAEVAGDEILRRRWEAFDALRELDAERFATLLAGTLDDLPPTPDSAYGKSYEESFRWLVCETDEPCAWQALERAARRADAGFRVQLLDLSNYLPVSATQRRLRLRFFAAFLADSTLRDASAKPNMYCPLYAAHELPRIEVRDFAAMKIAELLGLDAHPTPEWMQTDWANLRARMRATVQRELAAP